MSAQVTLKSLVSAIFALGLLVSATSGFAEQAGKKPGSGKAAPALSRDGSPNKRISSAGVTERDFAVSLVKALKWDGGLPAEPKDSDYADILSGRRNFKFEAENYYSAERDDVTLRTYNLYGPFSGAGWLRGVATPATVHMKVLVPLDGDYLLTVAAKGDGQRWRIGGKELTVSTGGGLREADAGTVTLKAGFQEVTVDLPPEGAVDYFVLSAPDLRPVEPLEGWNLDKPMTVGAVAEVAAVLFGSDENLTATPADQPIQVPASRVAGTPKSVMVTTANYLGKFYAPEWLRAGSDGSRLNITFTVASTGVYQLKLNFLGEELKARLDNLTINKKGKQFLDWVDLGIFRLKKGSHTLAVQLPPAGGVDVLQLEGRSASSADFQILTGIAGKPDTPLDPAALEKQIRYIADHFKARR